MRGARIPVVALAALLAMFTTGCSKSEPEQAPAACLEGPSVYTEALPAFPGAVRLQGETRISDCLVPGQQGGELAEVGSSMITVATRLNEEARRSPIAPETAELGYLVGAAERGAEGTAGIHEDLIRRLNTAARFSPAGAPSADFERNFNLGYTAGREKG
jgi:hypothetical protein